MKNGTLAAVGTAVLGAALLLMRLAATPGGRLQGRSKKVNDTILSVLEERGDEDALYRALAD